MTTTSGIEPLSGRRPVYVPDSDGDGHGHVHGICWAAVAAGALGAASLSLILLVLGVGLGLSSVSPWSSEGMSAEAFGLTTILWLTFTQLAASGMGGYLAGRLRARWRATHVDEVYFRDTAHGFLAWSLATLVSAAMLSTAISNVVGAGAKAGAAVAGTAATGAATAAIPAAAAAASGAGGGQEYFADLLFRSRASGAPVASPAGGAASAATASSAPSAATGMGSNETGAQPAGRSSAAAQPAVAAPGEVMRILANGASAGTLPPDDTRYLGQVVAQRTGVSQADAEARVTETFSRLQAKAVAAKEEAKAAADKARKASAMAALWMFVSLLIGAFVASFAATLGGRHRDQF